MFGYLQLVDAPLAEEAPPVESAVPVVAVASVAASAPVDADGFVDAADLVGTDPAMEHSPSLAPPFPVAPAAPFTTSASDPPPAPLGEPTMQQPIPNSDHKVIEYLSKKGYNRTEAMLRVEAASQNTEGRPLISGIDHTDPEKYIKAMDFLSKWLDTVLDIYKPELARLRWPVFVHAFLKTASQGIPNQSASFFDKFKQQFEMERSDELHSLQNISLPEHVEQNAIAKIYLSDKYRLTLSKAAHAQLVGFLESKLSEGGLQILEILSVHLDIKAIDRVTGGSNIIEQMLKRNPTDANFPGEDEGIPGHNPGQHPGAASSTLTRLKLGALPMEKTLFDDVVAELEEDDAKNPPSEGKTSLVQEFQARVKQEETDDSPSRIDIPYPASKAVDVRTEVLKIKEHRDRFKIGIAKDKLSVCMFTFHNTQDSVSVISMSDDNKLIAIGTTDHYIRIFTADGTPLPQASKDQHTNASERLYGHSGLVFGLSFSPSIDDPDNTDNCFVSKTAPYTGSRFLLSCSSDKTIRLWSVALMKLVMVYKSHIGPVFDVIWSPFGTYFASAGHDKKAHLWSTAKPAAVRDFVGHDQPLSCVAFHPNGAYVFTSADDKTLRMFSVVNGNCVRLFTSHTGYITALACSPTGKVLASADDAGIILLWDLASGRLMKRMKGHEGGGIWSISWNMEGNLLLSGASDGTVRLWDAEKMDNIGTGKVVGEGGGGTRVDGTGNTTATTVASGASSAAAGGSKKKAKGLQVSGDQVSAFPTKQTPVLYVRFTRMNLAIAAGSYQGGQH